MVRRDVLTCSSSQGKISQFSTFECDVAFGIFPHVFFVSLKKFSNSSQDVGSIRTNGREILLNTRSWDFSPLVCMLTDFQMWTNFWNKLYLLIMYLLIYYWIWFANIVLKIFMSSCVRDTALSFSFFVMFLSGFSISIKLTL